MENEKQTMEYKSIQKIRTGDKGFKDLSVTCVALANAQGGEIYIGYDDKLKRPLPGQQITQAEVNDAVTKLRSLCFNVSLVASEILADETGSHYFIIRVFSSMHSVATTSDGRIYIRVADKCEPVRSEDLQRLGEEKGSYQWELVRTRYSSDETVRMNLRRLADDIRHSSRVRPHIKQLDDMEIAGHYHLMDEGFLTHLGVTVIQKAEIIDTELLPLLDFVLQHYQLSQKAFTAFGIIAREKKILTTQLSATLQLSEESRLRSYVDSLLKDNIICKTGVKKGTQFFVNPQLIKNAKVNLKTTLKTVEPHVLKILILEDLKQHPLSKISEIAARLPEVDIRELRKILYALVGEELTTEGTRTDRRYALK